MKATSAIRIVFMLDITLLKHSWALSLNSTLHYSSEKSMHSTASMERNLIGAPEALSFKNTKHFSHGDTDDK